MKTATTTFLASTMLAMTAGAPAFAANNGQEMSSNGQDMSSQQSQGQHQNAGGTFNGTIQSVRTIKFNDGEKYVLAKIKNSQGNTAVLNLGTKQNLTDQDADVQEGQQIQASGRSGRVNDKPVLVVYSFKTSSQNGSTSSSQ